MWMYGYLQYLWMKVQQFFCRHEYKLTYQDTMNILDYNISTMTCSKCGKRIEV